MKREQDNVLLAWLKSQLKKDIQRGEYLQGFTFSESEYWEEVHPQLLKADHAKKQLRIIYIAENPVPF